MTIDLIQPRNIYAEDLGIGHIYLPTSLLTVAARLNSIGIDTNIFDENFDYYSGSNKFIGVTLLGAPYIPYAIDFNEKINKENDKTIFIGGQVVNGLLEYQFKKLFKSENIYNGNIDENIYKFIDSKKLMTTPEKTSLVSVYEKIDDGQMKMYLENEFSFYVSQGCKYNCSFCAAVRTRKNIENGKVIKSKEVYRDFEVIEEDLSYLIKRAKNLGLNELKIYMSNLDVFQNPDLLDFFAKICIKLLKENKGFKLKLRGLATVTSFLDALKNNRDCIENMVKAGFDTVGFGIDGMTDAVWKKIKKGHNTTDKGINAVKIAKEEFGITSEILMTMGYNGIDNEYTLQQAYEFTKYMIAHYNIIPRPHVAKDFIPGNDGWNLSENSKKIEMLLKNPSIFQSLDFTALPTHFTHPDKETRRFTKKYFLKICSLPECTTKYVKAITPFMSNKNKKNVDNFNLNRFDH